MDRISLRSYLLTIYLFTHDWLFLFVCLFCRFFDLDRTRTETCRTFRCLRGLIQERYSVLPELPLVLQPLGQSYLCSEKVLPHKENAKTEENLKEIERTSKTVVCVL